MNRFKTIMICTLSLLIVFCAAACQRQADTELQRTPSPGVTEQVFTTIAEETAVVMPHPSPDIGFSAGGVIINDHIIGSVGLHGIGWTVDEYTSPPQIRDRTWNDGLLPAVEGYGVELALGNRIIYYWDTSPINDWLSPTEMNETKIKNMPVLTVRIPTGRGTGYYEEYFAIFNLATCEQLPLPDVDADYNRVIYLEHNRVLDMSNFSREQLVSSCKYLALSGDEEEWNYLEKVLRFQLEKNMLSVELNHGWPIGTVILTYKYTNTEFLLDKIAVNPER